jgi:hypothetical protein
MTDVLLLGLAALSFLLVLLMIELGYRYRMTHRLNVPESNTTGPAIGMVLSLMSLVLAFSFSNAAGRLDVTRKAILQEANAIQTAWLRIDCAESQAQPRLRDLFRQYLDSRIYADEGPQLTERRHQGEISDELASQIWALAVQATPASRPPDRILFLPAVNAMIDSASARTLAQTTHLPPAIFLFLFGIVLIGAILVGITLASASRRLWLYRIVIATVLSSTLYAILDMEYPRLGAFNLLEGSEALLISARKSMR